MMQITEETYLGLLNEIAQLKDELVNQSVSKFDFTELKPNTTYIVEFREDMDICTIGRYMQKISEGTKEMHNKYIVSSPRIKFREENN